MSRFKKNLQGRRRKPPAAPAPRVEVLDVTIGKLRVRCAAAVALDPENCLKGPCDDGDHDSHQLRPGDLLIEEGQGDDWHGGVIVRQADRDALRAVLVSSKTWERA